MNRNVNIFKLQTTVSNLVKFEKHKASLFLYRFDNNSVRILVLDE